MVGHPLQAGRGEHEVHIAIRCPFGDVAVLELHAVRRVLGRLVEHRLRVVDADHLADAELFGSERSQLPWSTSEVDRSLDWLPARSEPVGRETPAPVQQRIVGIAQGSSQPRLVLYLYLTALCQVVRGAADRPNGLWSDNQTRSETMQGGCR